MMLKGREEQINDLCKLVGVAPPVVAPLPNPELALVAAVLYCKGHITGGRLREHLS